MLTLRAGIDALAWMIYESSAPRGLCANCPASIATIDGRAHRLSMRCRVPSD